MNSSDHIEVSQGSFLPLNAGCLEVWPTLCIGLDVAWYGGSKNDPSSQFDFLAAISFDGEGIATSPEFHRIRLIDRDPDAVLTLKGIERLIARYQTCNPRVVIAVDAPIQNDSSASPPAKKRAFRQCERKFGQCRKLIDRRAGGANGWHPNVQPGVPLASRVQSLIAGLQSRFNFTPWEAAFSEEKRLVIECFPAEAIWAAKRLGQYPEHVVASSAKAYKKQKECHLSAVQFRGLVETTLLEAFKHLSGVPTLWPKIVGDLLNWMQADPEWRREDLFLGGKLLDDVVDSSICLATALSYAFNQAHVWQDSSNPRDGHIIGPGRFPMPRSKGDNQR